MKRIIRTEEQIIYILQEHEAGAKCADLCREHGTSESTFYAWKAEYSGMTVSECPVSETDTATRHSDSNSGANLSPALVPTGSNQQMDLKVISNSSRSWGGEDGKE